VRIVFAGTPEPALPALDALVASDHDVVAVVTRPDAPRGRGRTLHPSPVAARAAELGIEVLTPRRPRDPEFVARLTELAPDCCPVVAYGALIPQHVLDIPVHGWVNLHFSLLPAWRGAAPVQHAIMAGDEVTGASTFRLVAELDAGPVFATVTDTISATDTAGDLLERLAASGSELLVSTLDGIAAGTLTAQEQPEVGVSFAPKLTVEDARIDWAQPAEVIDRRIRGCTPAPGAWTTFRGERLKVSSASPAQDETERLAAGRLQVNRRSVRVGTGTTALELGRVQAQGKKAMAAPDWARGLTFTEGELLGGDRTSDGGASGEAEAVLPAGV
jgi:methionyl-tRNA formyltransferase